MVSSDASVILPALNECANLLALVPRILAIEGVREVIIVDDASTDPTQTEWTARAKMSGGRVRYLRNANRLGLACSTLQGLRAARAPFAIVRDSDLNHDPRAIAGLLRLVAEGAQFGVASRYCHGRLPVGRLNDLFSILLSRFLKLRFGRISDWTYGYYILDRSLLNQVSLGWVFRGRGEYTLRLYETLLRDRNLVMGEVPTRVKGRGDGKSTTRLWKHGLAYVNAYFDSLVAGEVETALARTLAQWEKSGPALAGAGHSALGARARLALMDKVAVQAPVVDLACGNGAFTAAWLPAQVVVDGIERNAVFAQHARTHPYRRVFHSALPALPDGLDSYRTLLCCELLQYVRWEDLGTFFRAVKSVAASDARLYCLVPLRSSFLHRLRRQLRLGKADYLAAHDLPLLAAAAQEGGWQPKRAWATPYGLRRVHSAAFHAPSSWHVHCLVEFEPLSN